MRLYVSICDLILTSSISAVTVIAALCGSKFVYIKPTTVTNANVYGPKAAACPMETHCGIDNSISYRRVWGT